LPVTRPQAAPRLSAAEVSVAYTPLIHGGIAQFLKEKQYTPVLFPEAKVENTIETLENFSQAKKKGVSLSRRSIFQRGLK
jgi:hypothetical protein